MQRWLMAGLLAGFVLLAGVYSIVNPLFEAPDEVWHFEYVRWLAEGHGLPRPEELGSAPWRQEGSQPPLYYLLAAALIWPLPADNAALLARYNPHAAVGEADSLDNKNMMAHGADEDWPWQGTVLAVHLVRFFSIFLGLVTLVCTLGLVRTLHLPASVALLAALLVAANPQFLFLSAAVSNDNLVTACCAAGLWLLLLLLAQPRAPSLWQLVGLGALVGAAALSKVSGLALAALSILVLAWLAWRTGGIRRFVYQALVVTGVAIGLAGWWYWRNWQLYGDPLGLAAMFAVLPGRGEPLRLNEVLTLAPGIWRSYWAVFGWFNVVVEPWIYWLYSGISLLALVGLGIGWWRGCTTASGQQVVQWLVLVGWLMLMVVLVVRWAQISYPQGRLLFPAVTVLATLLACGWVKLWPRRASGWAGLLLACLLAPVALVAPWRWIGPAYRPPALLAADTALPNPVAVRFADQVALRGYSWSPTALRPGGLFDLTLYWSALRPLEADYSVFVHLVDDHTIIQAQRDSSPAGGNWPTRGWRPELIVPDQHRMPAVLPAPATFQVEVGLYDFASGQRLQPSGAGDQRGDAVVLGQLPVLPAGADERQPLRVNFGDEIALIDYTFDRWQVHAGDEL
ncbi:MAG TPA: DUF2142 domain-containing protein, partial [Caldilineaceae bacterium]|nr:DUF2142 domain-containing protein [Caldilineaceae bacterium]